MPATRWGVYHNLKESEYAISNNEIALFFSSVVNRSKFMDRYFEHRIEYKEKLKDNVLDSMNYTILADITLYKKIEKRGFRVWLKGHTLNEKELDTYCLRKMMNPNDYKWIILNKKLVG